MEHGCRGDCGRVGPCPAAGTRALRLALTSSPLVRGRCWEETPGGSQLWGEICHSVVNAFVAPRPSLPGVRVGAIPVASGLAADPEPEAVGWQCPGAPCFPLVWSLALPSRGCPAPVTVLAFPLCGLHGGPWAFQASQVKHSGQVCDKYMRYCAYSALHRRQERQLSALSVCGGRGRGRMGRGNCLSRI